MPIRLRLPFHMLLIGCHVFPLYSASMMLPFQARICEAHVKIYDSYKKLCHAQQACLELQKFCDASIHVSSPQDCLHN